MSFDRTIEALESIENRQVEVLIKEILDSNTTTISISGFGNKSEMLRFLQCLTEKALKKINNFDYVIYLHAPSIFEGIDRDKLKDVDAETINELSKRMVHAVADALNLIDEDNSKLRKLKTELDAEAYYTYSSINEQKELELIKEMKMKIYQTLKGKRFLLVTEQLNDTSLFYILMYPLMDSWLPGNRVRSNRAMNDDCWWLIGDEGNIKKYAKYYVKSLIQGFFINGLLVADWLHLFVTLCH